MASQEGHPQKEADAPLQSAAPSLSDADNKALDPPVPLQVTCIDGFGGKEISLSTPVLADETLQALRQRLADSLGKQAGCLQLFSGTDILEDSSMTVSDAVASKEAIITVVKKACGVDPESYEAHLQRVDWWKPKKGSTFYAYDQSCRLGCVEFPPASGIQINMMPIILGDKSSIPEQYLHYWPLIEACCPYAYSGACKWGGRSRSKWSKHGKIGFLTIDEARVPKGKTHRRSGLHVESPGVSMNYAGAVRFHWGSGYGDQGNFFEGGIYMASNIAKSSRIWEITVKEPGDLIGHLGDLEHVHELLRTGSYSFFEPDAGELVWLTDTTPHESLPLEVDGERQFFRLVTSQVSAWYSQHSTANPLGIVPDPKVTRIIAESKFEQPSHTSRKLAGGDGS